MGCLLLTKRYTHHSVNGSGEVVAHTKSESVMGSLFLFVGIFAFLL